MDTIKINEELNRIKLLFGDNLLYGNINNSIQEQRFVDFLSNMKKKSSAIAKTISNLEKNISPKIDNFKNYTISSGIHLLDHLTAFKNDIYKKIYTSNECDNMEKIARETFEKGDSDYMFNKVDGTYVFQRIPEEMRGEFFYWYRLKFPDKFSKYMNILKTEGESINFKDATGKNVSPDVQPKPINPKVEPANVTKPKVRVDENGNFLDFDSENNPLDMDGNKVDLSETTEGVGFKSKDITWKDRYDVEIDEGGSLNWKFDDDIDEVNPAAKFIGQMERTDINQSQKNSYRKNWFGYMFDRLLPRMSEFYKTFFKSYNVDEMVNKFNEQLNFHCNKALNGWTLDNEYLFRAAFNDTFTDFFRSLENDPELKMLSFDECWTRMVNELESQDWYANLDYEQKQLIKGHLDSLKDEAAVAKIDALGNKSLLGMGEPTINDYITKTKNEQGLTGRLLNFWAMVNKDFFGTIKITFFNNVIDKILSFVVNAFRYMFNYILRGSWLNPKYMRLQLAQNSKNLRAFSKQKYMAMLAYRIIGNQLIGSVGVFFVSFAWNLITKFLALLGILSEDYARDKWDLGIKDAAKTAWSYFLRGPVAFFDGADQTAVPFMCRLIPGYLDDFIVFVTLGGKNEAQKARDLMDENTDNIEENLNINADNTKYTEKEIQRGIKAEERYEAVKVNLKWWPNKNKRENLDDVAKYVSENLYMNSNKIDSDEELNREGFDLNQIDPYFIYDGKKHTVETHPQDGPSIVDGDFNKLKYIEWLDREKDRIFEKLEKVTEQPKSKLDKIKQKGKNMIQKVKNVNDSIYKRNNLIMENTPRTKFGEDNFKHWKDTFVFKSEDEKNPGQFKQVKINMEDVMDRINHYRKKYDEDDAFVRAVLDTHDNVVKVMYTKDLANISESARPRGLALLLREDRGELEIFSVSRPANGNWFLVKGDYSPSQMANMDLEKKEPQDKETKKITKPEEDLKKKEQESIIVLKRNEKDGMDGLPSKVKQKLKEKIRKGWTTEEPPSFLIDHYTESEINSVFNDPIQIYKLEPSNSFFNILTKNSPRVSPKRGFCRSLYNASKGQEMGERQRKTINHILTKCKAKFSYKFGVASF